MNGPLLLLFFFAAIVLLVKYPTRAKKVFAGVGQAMRASGGTPAGTQPDVDEQGWFRKKLWSILLVIGGAVALYWGFNTQMRPVDVGNWSYGKWLPLLIFWGFGAALIALNAKEKTAVTLQKVLMWVMLALLIALPLWSWIATPSDSTSQQAAHSEIPLASSPQSSWPKLAIPANGKSERIPVPPGMRIVMAGNKFLLHNVYRDGNECSFNQSCPDIGAVAGNYATNEAQETNIVAYAFAPI